MTHIRQLDAPTLRTVIDEQDDKRAGITVNDINALQIEFRLTASTPEIVVGGQSVPASEEGILAFGNYLGVPTPFLKRVGKEIGLDLQQRILTDLLSANRSQALRVTTVEGGVKEVTDPGKQVYQPSQLLRVAQRALGTDEALVQRIVDQPGVEFAFDVHVPVGYDRGVGGDPASLVAAPEALLGKAWMSGVPVTEDAKVGDITMGGLRFFYDQKRGLTPSAQTWFMRLACTNGMETQQLGRRVDGRGQTVDEVLAELEAQARIAFAAAERDIDHFYSLRDQQVNNPERALTAMARERDIPNRSLIRLLAQAPTLENPTRFDIVNLVTNLANDPAIANDGGRQLLERVGGSVVMDSQARCPHCEQGLHAH